MTAKKTTTSAATAASSAAAAKAEAMETPAEIEFAGETYTVPPALDLPVELLEADGELDVVRLILGDEQYGRFRSKPRTLRDLKDFGEALADAAGFGELGN